MTISRVGTDKPVISRGTNGTAKLTPVGVQGADGLPGTPGPGAAAWAASTAVTSGAVRQAPDGSWIKSTGNRTTRASFDATEQTFWTAVLGTSGTFEATALAASIAATIAATAGVNVKKFGAVGDDATDNTTVLEDCITLAATLGVPLYVPEGIYRTDALVVSGIDGFSMHMDGTLKRKNSASVAVLLTFENLAGARIGTINTDGNVANNQVGSTGLNEPEHCVKFEACTDLEVDSIHSVNPAGDSVYFEGHGTVCSGVKVGHISSVSAGQTGRNGLSIIAGENMEFGSVLSVNTGTPIMPGGVDLEPDVVGDLIDNVHFGSIVVTTAGTSGLGFISTSTKRISNVSVDAAHLTRLTNAAAATSGFYVMGVSNGRFDNVTVAGEGVGSCATLDNSDHLTLDDFLFTDSGGNALTIGPNADVTASTIRGSIETAETHGVQTYALSDSVVTIKVRNPGAAGTAICMTGAAVLSNVKFLHCDLRKDSTGARAFGGGGSSSGLTNVELIGCDFTGWAAGNRVTGGLDLNVVNKRDCPGLNTGTGTGSNFEIWAIGDEITNTAPAAASPPKWVCTVATPSATLPSAATWKAYANLV